VNQTSFKIRDRDDRGTDWTLRIPNAAGQYDIVLHGYFQHYKNRPQYSSWELLSRGTLNGQEFPITDLLQTLGHGCNDRAEEILDNVLSSPMRDDFDDWENFLIIEEFSERHEQRIRQIRFEREAI
jgi:hypothetical protein